MKAKLGLAFRDAKETGLALDSDIQFDVSGTMQLIKKDRVDFLDIGIMLENAKRPKFLLRFNIKESVDFSNFRVEYFKNGALRMFCIACDVEQASCELRYFFDNDCSFVKNKTRGSSFNPDGFVEVL